MRIGTQTRAVMVLVGAFLGLVLSGCETAPSADLDPLTKARLAKQYRKEAEDCLARFTQDTTALEDLECYAEKYRQTTVMFPDPRQCPSCYYNYGRGLSMLGGYYLTLRNKLKTQSPAEIPDLEERIEAADKKMRDYFRRSNETLEAFFQTGYANPRAYDMVSRQFGLLGNYTRALFYLNRLSQSGRLSESDKEIVARRRNYYKRMIDRQAVESAKDGPRGFDQGDLELDGFGGELDSGEDY